MSDRTQPAAWDIAAADQTELSRELEAVTERCRRLEAELRERDQQLAAADKAQREISTTLIRNQDGERRRLSRELHDSTAQLLAAVQMNLEAMQQKIGDDPRLQRRFADTIKLAVEATSDVRTLSYLLHPPLLDEAGLPDALRWYIEGFENRTNITVKLVLPARVYRFAQEVETTIFRIVQEALTNVYRHSASSEAAVTLGVSPAEVRLAVEDWGRGMPESLAREPGKSSSAGFGLRSMRERVRQFNGSIACRNTSPGESMPGTLVEIFLPVQARLEGP